MRYPNRQRHVSALAASATLLGLLAACEQPAPGPEPLRPVRTETIVTRPGARVRTFSGTARAGQETDLSFRVGGTVDLLDVRVGDSVRRGQIIARLDQTDFRIAVRRAQASLEQAQATARNADSDLERIRGLWESNNASQNDLDQAMSQAQSSKATVEVGRQSLAQAQRQLEYSTLRSPVDGSIAAVDIEVNENVARGDTVVRLTSGTRPEVEVTIPEVLISDIERGDTAWVTFSALPGRRFEALVTEVGVASTGAATTFPVTVRLVEDTREVRSGMAADVALQFESGDGRPRILLPAYAVGEDRRGRYVYLLESAEERGIGIVRRTGVEVGSELTPDGRLEIVSGLADGQRVVTAGVRRLIDGQRVKLLGG